MKYINCVENISIDYTSLARSLYFKYNTFMQDANVWEMMEYIMPTQLYNTISHLKKDVIGHELINDFVMRYYPGEYIVKYFLLKRYINNNDEVSAFEINMINSRLDVGRINGYSYAYEIKTEFDTLDKLNKQIEDYSKVFEYIYIVIHRCHLNKAVKMIPDHCGIITYRIVDGELKFNFYKKVRKNKYLSMDDQVKTLNSKELTQMLKELKSKEIPAERHLKEEIIKKYSQRKVNAIYKKILKERYRNKWRNLKQNFNDINPIDIQAIFKSGIDPKFVYFKNSFNV